MLCIYLFLTAEKKSTPTKKAPLVCKPDSHQYPVTFNGQLLDVAVIGESTQKMPQSVAQVVQYVAKTEDKGKVGTKRLRPS